MNARILATSGFCCQPLLTAMLFLIWAIARPPAFAAAEPPGKHVFQRAGCVACHGTNAEGTAAAPPLAGHTAGQVKRYVRNPHGRMPRFGPDKLNDADLARVASYIAGLSLPTIRVERMGIQDAIETHHWMAHHALRANNPRHGAHHLSHALELVKDDAHRRGIERLLSLARANRLEDAAHGVVEMVSAKVTPESGMEQMHVRLALGALDADDAKEVRHHLEHYIESSARHDRKHAEELLVQLEKGDLSSVRKRLAHLLRKPGGEQ